MLIQTPGAVNLLGTINVAGGGGTIQGGGGTLLLVPEPPSALLMAVGLLGAVVGARRGRSC